MASPIPRAPPVTSATCPSILAISGLPGLDEPGDKARSTPGSRSGSIDPHGPGPSAGPGGRAGFSPRGCCPVTREVASVPEPHMEELDQDECRRLLAERHLGRLAVPDFGGPMIFPVNYVVDEDQVVFRTDPGSKLDAATEREAVAFEVDATDEATRTGWSVVVRGILAEITDPAHLARLRALPLYPWAPGERGRDGRGGPPTSSGRRIRIPHDLPFTW